jgi:DNA gyrase subunit A
MTNSGAQPIDTKPVSIEEEMKRSYLDYAMSVIVSRALPDVRDGLKPVHRRILYAMKEAGNDYNRPYRKSARVVGDVMGKYHPHGNMAIYDAMVRLTQDFSLRLPLIDGQGNFGSMDGDPAAAERYTEARLSKAAHTILEDIDKDTVDFQSNYDDTLTEPKVLPARFPNLLVNGTNGIAVGMATSVPTHNLGEVIDACCALIENPDLSLPELMNIIPGPDFPTGGIIMGRYGLFEAYRTGRGTITVRGKTSIENIRNDREAIIVTEIPFQVNKSRMIEKIAELVKDKVIEGISDLRDESDREGVRVVIELKRDAVADVILNQLYRYSSLQTGISFNMLALVHGRPEQLPLAKILKEFLAFREEVILRRTRYELAKAREKAHILLGFAVAVANIEPIITLIRAAVDRQQAKIELMERAWDASVVAPLISLVDEEPDHQTQYRLTEAQAQAILDLRLHRLTGLEREKIKNDLQTIVVDIQEYLAILASRQRVLEILKNELLEIKNQFATHRKTQIEEGDSSVDIEDLIQREDMVITVSLGGYIKRVPLSTYRAQKRGGKGRSGMTTKDEDVVSDVIVANTHSRILFFSTLGKVYQMKAYRLPLGSPQARGRAMVNLLPLAPKETISTVLVMPETLIEGQEPFLMFATSNGNVRRNRLEDFASIFANGKRAMRLDENETLIAVALCNETDDIMLSTYKGICNRFNVTDIRIFAGRDSNGVRGIRLGQDDHVIAMTILSQGHLALEERQAYLRQAAKMRQLANQSEEEIVEEEIIEDEIPANEEHTDYKITPERFQELAAQEQFILTITENGFGKRSSAYEYRTTNRGSRGFTSIAVNNRNGGVAASFPVSSDNQILLVTDQGRLMRCPIHDVRITRRSAQGVIIFRVDKDEKVVAVSCIPAGEETEDEMGEGVTNGFENKT